jgi:hypothetical protein
MSSQGASIGSRTAVSSTIDCYGPNGGSQTQQGYSFSRPIIRDGSDWTSYKKQALIRNESKTVSFTDPWFVHGNDYRLKYMNGVFQNGAAGCTTSNGAAYIKGPF